jgi:hypothetical protein
VGDYVVVFSYGGCSPHSIFESPNFRAGEEATCCGHQTFVRIVHFMINPVAQRLFTSFYMTSAQNGFTHAWMLCATPPATSRVAACAVFISHHPPTHIVSYYRSPNNINLLGAPLPTAALTATGLPSSLPTNPFL